MCAETAKGNGPPAQLLPDTTPPPCLPNIHQPSPTRPPYTHCDWRATKPYSWCLQYAAQQKARHNAKHTEHGPIGPTASWPSSCLQKRRQQLQHAAHTHWHNVEWWPAIQDIPCKHDTAGTDTHRSPASLHKPQTDTIWLSSWGPVSRATLPPSRPPLTTPQAPQRLSIAHSTPALSNNPQSRGIWSI